MSKDAIQFKFEPGENVTISGFKEATIIRHADDRKLLVVSELGYAKRTPIDEYRVQKRDGKGLPTMHITSKTGPIVNALIVRDTEDVMVMTKQGSIIRVQANLVSVCGRKTQGSLLIKLDPGDIVTGAVMVPRQEEVEA